MKLFAFALVLVACGKDKGTGSEAKPTESAAVGSVTPTGLDAKIELSKLCAEEPLDPRCAPAGSAAAAAPVQPPAAEVALEVTAKQMFADYQDNEIAADAKYKDKLVAVSGKIARITEVLGKPVVELATANQFMPVYASFASKDELVTLKRGQSVTVRCRGNGVSLGHARIGDCSVAQTTAANAAKRPDAPPPAPPTAAGREALAKYIAEKSGAAASIEGFTLVLSGTGASETCDLLLSKPKRLKDAGFTKLRCKEGSFSSESPIE